MEEVITPKPLFQNSFILRKPKVAIFADIIKIVTILNKAIFKEFFKVKRIHTFASKWNLYMYFLIQQNLLIVGKKG